jgi:SAM-dependent methyltransferase
MHELLRDIAERYPADLVDGQLRDIPRAAFHLSLVGRRHNGVSGLEVADLGGGVGLFPLAIAAHGAKRVVLIDDFRDPVNQRLGESIFDLHRSSGVEVISRDVVAEGISDLPGQFDVISTFDSMEHWHRSPKELFHQVIDKLRPGGAFILGAPNCVNLRKRITTPLGWGKWSALADWYEQPVFRGHVREPDVADLRYIAADMGLRDVEIFGRNWIGHLSPNPLVRAATFVLDRPLRLAPSLCADLYMIGQKP